MTVANTVANKFRQVTTKFGEAGVIVGLEIELGLFRTQGLVFALGIVCDHLLG